MAVRRRRSAAALGTAILLAGSLLAGPGPAASAAPKPSVAEVAAQQRRAAQLKAEAARQAAAARAAQRQLAALAAAANAALDDLSVARQRLAAARDVVRRQQAELAAARARKTAARRLLDRFAAEAYQQGAPAEVGLALLLLTAQGPEDLSRGLALVGAVGERHARILDLLRSAERAETLATKLAEQAAQAALDAEALARAAEARAKAAVSAQQRLVAAYQARLARTRAAAGEAARRAAALARARAIALEQERLARLAGLGPGPGSCLGGQLLGYPNGRLPLGSLCPLWGSPASLLRADAARAFNRLSQEYAGAFGRPICVTDAYRSYASQLRLYRERPGFAAVPGTSTHGWGLAVDLCGGIQYAGTPAYQWMTLNATRLGWFHPSWAQPGGALPEPWHWEFSG